MPDRSNTKGGSSAHLHDWRTPLYGLCVRVAAVVFVTLASAACARGEAGALDARPNILLIVADDLAYADVGAYGSDIDTPNIDALAEAGLLFTEFHAAPSCALTRAMLLTGNNNHVAGMARQNVSGLAGEAVRGYENHLSDRVVPFPILLRDSGYHTYIAGKWHLGKAPEHSPVAAGFERAYNILDGGGSHFSSTGYSEGGSTYREGNDLVDYPEGRYSTELYTDKLIEFIDSNRGDGKPFFAFAAYTSPHWPLQVPDEYLDLYRGRYDEGYDVLREERFESLKAAGIIPAQSVLPPRNAAVRPWDDLDAEARRRSSRKMELYAAMLDNLDDHIGRLLQYLRDSGLYENTLVVFMSDNGPDGGDVYNRGPFVDYLQAHYDNAWDKLGTAESFASYGAPWAEAGSAPFARYKGYTREGGMVSPLIITGPGLKHRAAITSTYVTHMDIAPTFLELAGAPYPDDGSVEPMLGESMRGLLMGDARDVHDDRYVTTLFHNGRAFLRQGNWKISTLERPFDESAFELFDLSVDPGEVRNIAAENPDKLKELIGLWRSERRRLGIILPEDL